MTDYLILVNKDNRMPDAFIDSPALAKEITDRGLCLEEYHKENTK